MPRGSTIASAGLRALADEDLMALADTGDGRAFEVIFDRHADAAFSLACRMCPRSAVAEAVVQGAFVSLRRTGARYDRARGSVRSWILTDVHRRAINVLRHTVASDGLAGADEPAAVRMSSPGLTDTEAAPGSDARRVREALEELPPDQRQVITLAYFGGSTHTQIAETISVPVGTVKSRMRLGLAKMRTGLAGCLPDAPQARVRRDTKTHVVTEERYV